MTDIMHRRLAEQESRLLYGISSKIRDAANTDGALGVALEEICEATGWVTGQAWVRAEDSDLLAASPAFYCRALTPQLQRFREISLGCRFQLGEGLLGQAWSEGRPIWIEDLDRLASFQRSSSAAEAGIRSAVGFPIMAGDRIVAVLEFCGAETRATDSGLVEMISSVTTQLGDMIHRRRAVQALNEQREILQTIFDHIPVMVGTCDREGRIKLVNREWERVLGWTAEEMRKVDLSSELFGGDARREVGPELIEAGAAEWRERPTRARDGRMIDAVWARIQLTDGTLIHIGQDVSLKKHLEEQLRHSQKMEAVGQFAGGVAHDFNNLLAVISGYTQMILNDLAEDAPLREPVREVLSASNRAAGLTNQLLAFSRRQKIHPRIVDLNSVLTNADGPLRRLLGEGIELHMVMSPRLGRVKVDLGQIEQVIMNLAVNAREAMPDGGRLTIETANVALDDGYVREHLETSVGSYVMLAVSDDGEGMDEKTRQRIFEPFFSTKGQGRGTGLGLAMVYAIVKQNQGLIWVYSEPGVGTVFKIYLPRVQQETLRMPPVGEMRAAAMGRETILLVEDDPGVRRMVRQMLQRLGYHVIEAGDAASALAVCQRHTGEVHLLLSDVVMPEKNGPELAEELKALRPEMKVLFMSGYTDEAIVYHGVLAKGVDFLQKPFTPETLGAKLSGMLGDAPSTPGRG